MGSYHKILDKLNGFVSKYYRKLLVKGLLLFFAFGLLFFLAALSLEYFLWMGSTARLLVLVMVVVFEAFLLYRFILTPLFYLFRIKKGISNKEASLLIGKHFPLVDDKLYNLLELAEDEERSELLLASIEQRSHQLDTVPFVQAIDFKENLKYAKYGLIPLVLIALIGLTGNLKSFFGSYERVVNYDLAYEPPAPFQFQLLNDELRVFDDQPLLVQMMTEGKIQPEDVYIVVDGQQWLLQKTEGVFEHRFAAPVKAAEFYFSANGYRSRAYTIISLPTPSLQDFELHLQYPTYTGRTPEVLKGTGNATIPEGTETIWKITGKNTERIDLHLADTLLAFGRNGDAFSLGKRIYKNLDYGLSTSNENVKNHEFLEYSFKVVRDASPQIKVEQAFDSLNLNESYYSGQVSDDYLVDKIRVVCSPKENPEQVQRLVLQRPKSNVQQFFYTFPSGLDVEPGNEYQLVFEVVDNDGLRGGKIAKSQVFSTILYSDNELKNKDLEFQESVLDNFDKSLEKLREQKSELEKINEKQKEQKGLDFNDKNQIKNFLRKQQQQEDMMQKFSKQLKESLDKQEKDDALNELLKERLERQEMEAKKNAKLLEELNKIADKIEEDDLKKRLEELSKQQGKNQRNLEQLLELTKRYYVTEKASQLAQELAKLAERQEMLSELKLGEDFSNKEQEKLNEDFEKLSEELDELQKDNQDLKKPLDLEIDENKQEGVKQDQQDALEEINKHQGMEESSQDQERQNAQNNASQKQKSAAQKMKEMSESLQQGASMGGGSSITEDAEMLRQILDNLVIFSFKQESLFDRVEQANIDVSNFSETVREQKELRNLFEHVDDSLFALSLRRAELSEFVNEQVTEVYYNIDKSLESIAENQVYQGAAYQQYVINAGNALADFLANILDNMQMSMQQGSGSGQSGSDFQLPDIIQGQGQLNEKMGQMGQSGKGEQESQSGEKSDGQQEGHGEKEGGKKGNQEGQNGKDGKDGKNGGDGENGQNGQSGDGMSEEELKEIYEIYKQQQLIRQQLEQQLQDMINKSDRDLAKKLVQQMENFENDLLENGITRRTMNKANYIQHQLLKLENATLKQGEKKERESTTNTDRYKTPILTKPELFKNNEQEIEILNRQALPLRQEYRRKVREYFKND
ncbi:DUF4175 family protein [Allomuricauda sp. SCSIO 65647]|uniref:DUF4175 family protein n=1 Tax=Allomuricauda sp. SCSIO 65647 TaxID=2908843 RepID=UPI001F2400BB|nr:DUF4175 family protein [Muricauda sp. SCSIO 65647]UJH69064.1 hypothetical protein L0P89_07580 [Muricauda sp. SCSIO 65647]